MDTVHIHHFTARYRLTNSAQAERERLDKLLKMVFEDALEQALVWAGVSVHEEICIRQLNVPVRLCLTKPDSALVLAWSVALAEAIKQMAESGYESSGVIRYGSRVHALIDLALSVTHGDYRRTWAWRHVGLWHAPEHPSEFAAAQALVQALTEEAHLILPVIRTLTVLDRLAFLIARLVPEQWIELAQAVLNRAGLSSALLDVVESSAPVSPDVRDTAHKLLAASTLTKPLLGLATASADVRRAAAFLVAFDAEPNALRASEEITHALLRTVSEAFAIRAAIAETEALLEKPPRSRSQEGDREISVEATKRISSVLCAAPFSQSEGRDSPAVSEEFPLPVVRQQGTTRFGGLLFLLGVLDDLGLPEEILAQSILLHRGTRWVLHQLALALVPADSADPAVLAFAGLLPDAEAPSKNEEPPAALEGDVIALYAARLREAIRERLDRHDPDEALQFVCHRYAVIVADPGWIEVRFALTEVSTEIRRAALDLNPDYLPWLGVVVKFVYE